MTFVQDLLLILLYLKKSFEYYEMRLAVSSLTGEGNFGINSGEVFEYLLRSYISFLVKHNDYAIKYNGFMEKSSKEIHNDTNVPITPIPRIINSLAECGLIDINRGGRNNSYLIRINENCIGILYEALEESYNAKGKKFNKSISNDIYDTVSAITSTKKVCDEEYLARREEEKQKRKEKQKNKEKENSTNNILRSISFDKLNENPYDIDNIGKFFSVIKDEKERLASCYLVYLFSYYYQLYTGKDYEWDYEKYSILMDSFRDYYNYDNKEICISLTLRKVLNIKETDLGGKRKKEITFAEKYNHDYRETDLSNYFANKNGYQGFKFDNILGVPEYSKVEYFEENTSSYVEDYSNPERLAMFD